ncbi:zinc finger protein 62 homolog isoform X1 [Aricia agestis]|uniref:zinc finger protein 62 homolog isoform X1 n=1 Tax=Aricia agestis TaxID=91739 RepID=UPI001C2019A3|nr:zinc finger protein 62 homolog isoform X1 [Aricia agestis]
MEFQETVVKDSPGLCRCCLSEGCYKELGAEYTWFNETEIYADMLLDCFDISISQHVDGPNGPNRLICEVCITRLRDACEFKKQVLESEKKFINMVCKGEFSKTVLVYKDPVKVELKDNLDTEYLDEDLDLDNDDLPEKIEIETPLDNADLTASVSAVKKKRGRPKKTLTEEEKPTPKKAKLEDKPRTSKDEFQGIYSSERRRRNLQIIFNNTSIIPFKWKKQYVCFYCGEAYAEYEEFRKHTKSHGMCTTSDNALKMINGRHIEVKLDTSEIYCEICDETFQNFKEIIDHLITEHKVEYDKDFDMLFQEYRLLDNRCRYCDEEFTDFRSLLHHMKTLHTPKDFICDSCGAGFKKKIRLSNHLRTYHRDGGYSCDLCSEMFESRIWLKKHQNNFHPRDCKACNASFPSCILLQEHIERDHPDDGDLKCAYCHYCLKKFHTKQELNQHIGRCKMKLQVKVSHDTNPSGTGGNRIQPRKRHNTSQMRKNIHTVLDLSTAVPFMFTSSTFCCFYCPQKFFEFDDLREHTLKDHPVCESKSKYLNRCKGERVTVKIDISSLSCTVCGLPMEGFDNLIDHIISEHRSPYDKSIASCFELFKVAKDNIPCPYCPKVFRYFGILLKHINSDHNDNCIICDFCGKSFKKVTNLKLHIGHVHTGPYECEICGSKLKNQSCLKRHKAKHHNEKDIKCSKCPERFASQYHKQKHLIQAHDIGHRCSYCDKIFTRNSFMKDHIRRTHLKEKDVVCSVCNDRFFDNYHLKLHMVKHQGQRSFICDVCGKAFLRRRNLSTHMEMHKKYGQDNAL